MKRYMKIILVLLCMAVFTVGSAENVIFNDHTLELLNPCVFFDGKYTFSSVRDPNDLYSSSTSNFLNWDFTAVDDITKEETEADAARYRQALIDSGCFKQSKTVSTQLVYIGGQEVASATNGRYTFSWHVEIFALDASEMRINLVEGLGFSDGTAASDNQKSAARTQGTAGTKAVATNDGLTVLSPEQYLGIDPCDEIYRDDNHYTYAYTDRGYKYHGSGTANPVDWYKMEEYVNALVESGYYEILEHSDDPDDAYWTLRYIGPAEVKNTFYLYYGMSDQAAITLRNFIGDIKVRYSIDILTADIDETQQRLGEYVLGTQKSTSSSSSIFADRCTQCGGDGRCNSCGGSGKIWKWAGDMYAYVRCTECSGGTCTRCGGDGVR